MTKVQDSFLAAQVMVAALVMSGAQRVQQRRDERGVVSIEYVVLGVAIIAIIGFLGTNQDLKNAIRDAFKSVFDKAKG